MDTCFGSTPILPIELWREITAHLATKNHYDAIISLMLISKGLKSCFVHETVGWNELWELVCEENMLRAARILLSEDAIPEGGAIVWASELGHLEIVHLLLLDGRVDPTVYLNKPSRSACEHGHVAVLHRLLQDKRVVSGHGAADSFREWMQVACSHGHAEVVRFLLEDERADPRTDDNEAIKSACMYGNAEVVRILLADGRADPADEDNEAVWLASASGHADVLRYLLRDNRVDPSCRSLIAVASGEGHVGVVRLLLEDGRPDPTAKDNEAARLAYEKGHTEVLRLLLEDGRTDPTVLREPEGY